MAIALATLFFLLFFICINFPMIHSISEAEALLTLKSSFSNSQALESWVNDSVPCSEDDQWEGVICYNGLVTGLRLEKMGLLGKIDVDALVELKGLRTISLISNSFSGSIPKLNKIGFLKAMYLSGNNFSGDIPQDYFQSMRSLKKLWLSHNKFSGQIPSSLAEIPSLIELHLENNEFSGTIPNLDNPSLVKFNVSNNKLEGEVPSSLLKFNESSFGGNSGLCGGKFGKPCEKVKDDSVSDNAVDAKNIGETKNNNNNVDNVAMPEKSKGSSVQIGGIVVTSVILVSLIVFFIVRSKRKKGEDFDMLGQDINEGSVEVQVTAPVKRESEIVSRKPSSSRRGGGSTNKGVGELMILNDEKGVFGLPDLMRASAEVLGNGGFGSSYKAVMSNGVAVVVKRTRELNGMGKDGFDAEMKRLGRLKNWNILTPLAYHYRKEEKLVISEYVPRGSLLYLLHGDRGPSHSELDWPARLKIMRGIAQGMHYLHTELVSSNLPHGNLKSSNILLGPDYEPLIVDYGFNHLVNPSCVSQALFAYKSPEVLQGQHVSHKSDVYCLGVVILEILTGKFPSQYLSNNKGGIDVVQWVMSAISDGREVELLDPEIASNRNSLEEMVKLMHVGAACTESNAQKRIDMKEVVRRIEEINDGGQGSRTIEVLPSLKDGYADSHQVVDAQGNNGSEESRRRHGTNSSGSKEDFDFVVS